MSKASIEKFLKRIEKELADEKRSVEIRKRMNRSIVHSFTMSVEDNIAQIMTQLQLKGYPLNDEVIELVKKQGEELYDAVLNNLKKDSTFSLTDREASELEETGAGDQRRFTVTIRDPGTGFRGKDKRIKRLDYFDKIKENYKGKVNTIANQLNRYYAKLDPNLEEIVSKGKDSNFLDLGHREGSEVAGEESRIAKEKIYKQFTSKRTKAGKLSADDLNFLGIDLAVLKRDSEEKSVVEVSLESAKKNRGDGAKSSADLKKDVRKVIRRALDKLGEDPSRFKGSDSRIELDRKRIIKAFQDGVKTGNPKAKVTQTKKSDTKAKPSSGKKVKKKMGGGKHKKGQQRVANLGFGIAAYTPPRESGAKKQNLLRLAALINTKLPNVVRKNMGPPGLVNRSGRFAASAEVTEVSKTKQGFPSIGFTYERNPYQIFEPGAGRPPWASNDRDPRKVIDQSIREIARGLIEGRFYTRRV